MQEVITGEGPEQNLIGNPSYGTIGRQRVQAGTRTALGRFQREPQQPGVTVVTLKTLVQFLHPLQPFMDAVLSRECSSFKSTFFP